MRIGYISNKRSQFNREQNKMFQHRANMQTRDYIKFYRGKFQGNESRLVENEARRTRIPKQVKYPQRNFQRSVQLNDAPR